MRLRKKNPIIVSSLLKLKGGLRVRFEGLLSSCFKGDLEEAHSLLNSFRHCDLLYCCYIYKFNRQRRKKYRCFYDLLIRKYVNRTLPCPDQVGIRAVAGKNLFY